MESNVEFKPNRTTVAKGARRSANQVKLKSEPPLYIRVAHALKEEIVSGVYPVGSQLPAEEDLCKRFSVSRYTVREALRLLRGDDLVASRQGAGTIVIPPRASSSDIHQVMSINDLAAFGTDTRLAIDSIKTVVIDEKLAVRTGLPSGEEWLEVLGYRHTTAGEAPVCRVEYYINRDFAAVGRLLQRHTGPIFQLIEDMFGQNVIEVHQQISATLISSELAVDLKVKEASAALEVRRTYITTNAKIAQVTINTHPAARFQHSMTMRRVKT